MIALYEKIKEVIYKDIKSGHYPPQSKIPTEKELCKIYNVSKITVRRAVEELVADGLLLKRQGKGTYVLEPKITKEFLSLTGFSEDVKKKGMKPDSVILEFEMVNPPTEVIKKLSLSPGEKVIKLKRIRRGDQKPMILETAYIPSCYKEILNEDFSKKSLYEYFEKKLKLEINRSELDISACKIRDYEAKLLDCAKGAATLCIERTTYLTDGKIMEYSIGIYHPQRYKFHLGLLR